MTDSTPRPSAAAPCGVFLAAHRQDTGMRDWDLDRWKREIDAIKRMGANTVWYLPIQYGQRQPDDFEPDAEHWRLQQRIGEAIVEAGLSVGVYQGLNDVFPRMYDAHPQWAAPDGHFLLEEAHLCPSIPEAWEQVMALRRRFFAELPRIDYLITPATDYGGCGCDRCDPWPETYLKRFEQQAALCREHHPRARIVAAGHGLSGSEEDLLRRLLRDCDWVDHVADIPRGAGKSAIKYYMYPETTMLGGWGKFGAAPILRLIEETYRADQPGVGGRVPYSEGIHDDVNRFACLRMARNPDDTADAIAEAYARDWLGLEDAAAREVAEVILGLGGPVGPGAMIYVHPDHAPTGEDADERVERLRRVRGGQTDVAGNYRYWLLQFRALSESMSRRDGPLSLDDLYAEFAEARAALRRLEPAYAAFLDGQKPGARPDATTWIWPRSFHRAWHREMRLAAEAAATETGANI